ncbi:MAG: hypothetical protein KAX09_02455 [Candidatus Heimdallarchaeota archaeon]|nr:hypothetical protein [Candidatus Heimdallarchaeota archaeon]MCK4289821.1 hypothetical protein [Candidatus Heimdallarchaeota archaeon]
MGKRHCFTYQRDRDEFTIVEKTDMVEQYFSYLNEEPAKLETYASQSGSDAVLLYDTDENKWTLIYAQGSGIVTQRTARRRADSASRSGIQLSSGERVGANALLVEISDSNIGDLSKSVQNKYLSHTDLRGIE